MLIDPPSPIRHACTPGIAGALRRESARVCPGGDGQGDGGHGRDGKGARDGYVCPPVEHPLDLGPIRYSRQIERANRQDRIDLSASARREPTATPHGPAAQHARGAATPDRPAYGMPRLGEPSPERPPAADRVQHRVETAYRVRSVGGTGGLVNVLI